MHPVIVYEKGSRNTYQMGDTKKRAISGAGVEGWKSRLEPAIGSFATWAEKVRHFPRCREPLKIFEQRSEMWKRLFGKLNLADIPRWFRGGRDYRLGN